ncbi:caspase recruitment domain-containing protein 11-like [Mizuhopecten yessoensis]|uniref:caspase recruitment domain-containing protein 11-like n=1 Tax=Mizuhopecten yessoensis TaxID=6573 RepID=UPI000B45B159|nr:caspase recruitment domain-containing protein 11-like [Mizuhopecten yessoensis]XP_021374417.1 caspase recruitment domain-containing protein 11-like [Mizuhopecten yessoensis]XP_021374418.1 caspase recruitment domain-containing protein 11-like [Mizuhopecten yessoensis]
MEDLDICEDLYDRKIEPNRCQLIKYIETGDILDELRQNRTIGIDDYEEVQACASRRRRTAKLLDILQTKGDKGVEEFLKTIELIYPDLYQAVTGESPRKPPPNFLRCSRMPSMRTINHLPQLAQELKTQYQNNKQLVQQLQELENAMVFEQNDNKELEKENSELRKRIDSLKKGSDALESQVASFMTENHKLKDESLNYLKTSLEYHQQSELYKQRAREIQTEKDEMERTFRRIRQEHQEGVRQSRLSFGVSIRPTEPDPSVPSTDVTDQSALEANLMLQQQMLNEKLEEMQQELAQTAEDLHMSRTQTDEFQNLHKNVKETCERLKKERTKMDSLLEKQLSTTNHYFEMIQKLEDDKKMLEDERIKEQKKVSEESEKRNKLFMEKHKLEQDYTALCTEVEYLRGKRNSQESQDSSDDQLSQVSNSRDGDVERTRDKRSGIYSNNSSIHVHPGTVRKPSDRITDQIPSRLNTQVARLMVSGPRNDDNNVPERVYRRGKLKDGQYVTMEMIDEVPGEDKSFKSDESVHTSEDNGLCPVLEDMLAPYIQSSSTNPPSTYTIKIPTPLLKDKFEITGGNMTGIYVKKVTKKKLSQIQEGDKILSVGVFITDVQALHTDLVYRTFEEATHILQAQADPRHANVVEIKLQRDPDEYERALKWINLQGSGDLFYVKSNFTLEEENSCPNIQNGEIFCVSSTMTGISDKYWKAFRFDNENNSWSNDPVSLPNVSEVLKLRRAGISANRQRGRAQAFRHRPYSRVLPTKSPSTDYSTDNEALSQSTTFPVSTKFDGKVHWHKEGKLEMMDVERYRHLLGYSSDVSFAATSIDLDGDTSKICNSICLSNEDFSTK